MAGNRFLLADAFVRIRAFGLGAVSGAFRLAKVAAIGFLGVFRSITAAVSSFLPIAGALGPILAVVLPLFAAARFEQSMANVQAITLGTAEDFEELSAAAREMGRTTMFSARQAGDAQANLAQKGLNTNQILAAGRPVLTLAAAANLQLAESANIVSGTMGSMGLNAAETTRIVDVFGNAFSTANANVSELGQAFAALGPTAKNFGLSIEETGAVFQIMSQDMIKGGMAGTQLKTLLLRLAKAPADVKKGLKALNTELDDGTGKFKRFSDIVNEMTAGLTNLTQIEGLAAQGNIAGVRAALGLQSLLARGGAEIERRVKILGRAGTAAEQMAIKMDTVIGKLRILFSAISEFGIQLGQFAQPITEGTIALIQSVVDLFNRLGSSILPQVKGEIESVGEVMKAVASAIDSITPQNLTQNLRELGDLVTSTFNAVGETIFDILVAVFKRLAQEARAIFFDIAADIASATTKQREEQIDAAFDKFGFAVPGGQVELARQAALAAAALFGEGQEANFRKQAEEARKAAADIPLFGEGGAIQDALGAGADRISEAASKFIEATAPGRLAAFAKRLTDAGDALSEAFAKETDVDRRALISEGIGEVADLVAKLKEVVDTEKLSAAQIRVLDEGTRKAAERLRGILDVEIPGQPKALGGVKDELEEAASQAGQSQAVAASMLQAHFQGLNQTDKKILAAVEEGNELAEDGNDALDDIAANTARLVPGGWVQTGGAVGGAGPGVLA